VVVPPARVGQLTSNSGQIAQSVERTPEKREVVGSIPTLTTSVNQRKRPADVAGGKAKMSIGISSGINGTENHSFWERLGREIVATELDDNRVSELLDRFGNEWASGLLADPPASLANRRSERASFEARLLGRWGRALDLFELTTEHALQTSVWVRQNLCDQDPSPARSEALIRLHARALSIAQEVHVLLKSGYATAAYARWRTLYEVQIVFDTLAAADNSLSDRYLRHDVVEQRQDMFLARSLDPENDHGPETDPIDLFSQLGSELGESFLKPYGWAAPLFGHAPKFSDLEKRALDIPSLRLDYRFASRGVHANPGGVLRNIQSPDVDESYVWAGPSNAGLSIPARQSLLVLHLLTVSLISKVSMYEREEAEPTRAITGTLLLVTVTTLSNSAMDLFETVEGVQLSEEEAQESAIDEICSVLRSGPPMTGADLAEKLDIDEDRLAEALHVAELRGRIDSETRFH
jgi:Family of unknown function (DUF5677)